MYLRGWRSLHRRDPARWHVGRPAAFLGGLAAILSGSRVADRAIRRALAASSHAAAPAADDGRPAAHLARLAAISAASRLAGANSNYWIAPLLRWRALRKRSVFSRIPFVAWPLYVGTTWLWHTPRGYELGLSQGALARCRARMFRGDVLLLFWYPVVRPYPSRPTMAALAACFPICCWRTVQNTVLAAWLCFSPVVLYPYYSQRAAVGWVICTR